MSDKKLSLGKAILIGAGAAAAAAAAYGAVMYRQFKKDVAADAEFDEEEELCPCGCEGECEEGTIEIDDTRCYACVNENNTVTMDTDGDGEADAVALDTNGDGQVDTVMMDTTGDGNLDTALIDTNGDGCLDTAVTGIPAQDEEE